MSTGLVRGVAILQYRNWPRVSHTIDDALNIAAAVGGPLILLDSASEDGSVVAIGTAYPGLKLVGLAVNGGYAAGMNEALRRLTDVGCDLALLMTHEVRLSVESALALFEALANDPTLWQVGPLLDLGNEEIPWSTGGRLSRAGRPSHNTQVSGRRTQWLDGAVMAIRPSQLLSIGGFDESYVLYWEDVDLSIRIVEAGHRIAVIDAARASQETSLAPPYLAARGAVVFARKGLGGVSPVLSILRLLATCLVHVTRRNTAMARLELQGMWDAYRGLFRWELALVRRPFNKRTGTRVGP